MSGSETVATDRDRTRRILRLALPPARRLWAAIALGALSGGSAVALLGVSAWLITRASEQPALLYISMAVVGVRAFALGRAFFRYLERLVGHDAAFRRLGDIRADLFARLVPLGPDGVGAGEGATGRPAAASCSRGWRTTWTSCPTSRCGSSSRWCPEAW
ncbi:hypothetical protein [Leifsonia sp. P73]|uniref:hypothetical protein n=1 Tax=Leifsonia sp. P73 TaxID=3423959 RepID=UPI003DA31083